VCFQEAIKISSIPFPFPYAQTCDALLIIHWIMTPLVVSQWFTSPFWAGLFTFITVFIFWVLNSIAVEIENPFGTDPNDIDCEGLQHQLNRQLLQLLTRQQQKTPTLVIDAQLHGMRGTQVYSADSFLQVWNSLDDRATASMDIIRSCRNSGQSNPRQSTFGNLVAHLRQGSAGLGSFNRKSTQRSSGRGSDRDDDGPPLPPVKLLQRSSGCSRLSFSLDDFILETDEDEEPDESEPTTVMARGSFHCQRKRPVQAAPSSMRVSVSDIDEEASISPSPSPPRCASKLFDPWGVAAQTAASTAGEVTGASSLSREGHSALPRAESPPNPADEAQPQPAVQNLAASHPKMVKPRPRVQIIAMADQ